MLIVFLMVGVDLSLNLHMNTYFRELSSEGNILFFASVSFSAKFTSGIGSLIGGIALDLISWPRGVAIQSAADVPPDTLVWLGLIYGPIVSGFAVVSVWCYSKHRLDRHRHAEIVQVLDARRRSGPLAVELAPVRTRSA